MYKCLLVVVKLPFDVHAKWVSNSTDLWLLCSVVAGCWGLCVAEFLFYINKYV